MKRNLVWTDSVAMGIILIVIGLSVCLAGAGVRFPFFLGALVLGVLLAGVGIALVRQGLRLRPRETTHR